MAKMSLNTANAKLKGMKPIGFNDLVKPKKKTKTAKAPKMSMPAMPMPKMSMPKTAKAPKKGLSAAIAIGKKAK